MPVNAFTSWLTNRPFGVEDPGTPVHYGPEAWSRDPLDAKRMAQFTPEATYPDGYLGTIRSRRDDRLLNDLKDRQGKRPYQRGVHKGERVDPRDYYWDSTSSVRLTASCAACRRSTCPTVARCTERVPAGALRTAEHRGS